MTFDRILAQRALGVATTAYGTLVLIRPQAMTKPARLTPTTGTRRFVRALGVRDVASGLAMIATADRPEAGLAVAARVLADASDVLVFSVICPRGAKLKSAGVAGVYGLLNALVHPQIASAITGTSDTTATPAARVAALGRTLAARLPQAR